MRAERRKRLNRLSKVQLRVISLKMHLALPACVKLGNYIAC